MKPATLDFLFQQLIFNFAHLVTWQPLTKQQFLDKVKDTYSLTNPKTLLFYKSIEKSIFDTIRLNDTHDSILFNQ